MLVFFFNAAFTLNGFDDQIRSLTFVKRISKFWNTNFKPEVLKKAFYSLHKLNIVRADNIKTL